MTERTRSEMQTQLLASYESPIEAATGYALWKRVARGVFIEAQHRMDVPGLGRCRVDLFIRDTAGKRYVVECDGKPFHDAAKDLERDRAMLNASMVDVVYRLTGATIHHRIGEAVYLMSATDPNLFDPRWRDVLHHQFGQWMSEVVTAGESIESNAFDIDGEACEGTPGDNRTYRVAILRRTRET